MKIGFVFDDTLDNPDGVQQYIFALSDYYLEKGHEVHFLVGHTKRDDLNNVHSLSKTIRIKFNGNVVGTPLPANKKLIKEKLNDLNLDVIHVQMPYSPVLAGRVVSAASSKTAVIGTLHIFPKTKFENALNRLLKAVNSKTLKRFDEIVAVSEVAKTASHIKGMEIDIVPNPVKVNDFKVKKNVSNSNYVAFLGRLVNRKGSLELLKAVNHLRKKEQWPKGWSVKIGGKGPMTRQLKDYIKNNKLSSIVEIKGFISADDKPSFLANSEIAVFPSKGGESFGIVLLEAMAAGSVTLGGDNPGYSCVMTGNLKNQLFKPRHTKNFAKLLKAYIDSETKRKNAVTRQNKHVKQYDISQVGKIMINKYSKSLRQK